MHLEVLKERRKETRKLKYRSGVSRLIKRSQKKLTEKYSWFNKQKKEKENDGDSKENKLGLSLAKLSNLFFKLGFVWSFCCQRPAKS